MKNIGSLTLLITATLLFMLAFPAAAAGPKGPPVARPRLENALGLMREARKNMANAEGEFHGHRDKAVEHLNAAIHEAEICEQEP